MSRQKIIILIPLSIISCFTIYTWGNILFTNYAATWRHYTGLISFLILIYLFFTSTVRVIVATGVFLLLATFNVLAITTTITTSWITIFSIPTPPVQLLSLGIFILYFILNMNALIDIHLDYRELKEMKRNNKNSN